MATPDEILKFWFGEEPTRFDELIAVIKRLSPSLDEELKTRYGTLVEQALSGELASWQATHEGSLALVLLLDQFPRHAFRGTARQYEGDAHALTIALGAFREGWALELPILHSLFFMMPFVHSERLEHSKLAGELHKKLKKRMPDWFGGFAEVGSSQAAKYADILERFGRFPHRNEILGRPSTPEELEWIEGGGIDRLPPDFIRKLMR